MQILSDKPSAKKLQNMKTRGTVHAAGDDTRHIVSNDVGQQRSDTVDDIAFSEASVVQEKAKVRHYFTLL